jgi:hypothetical protein
MSNKRKKMRAPLDVFLNKYVSGVPYLARTKDISAEGVSLTRLIEPMHGRRRVGLQFQLPGTDEVIYAEGEIVREWANERAERAGIRFTLLTERHRRLIDGYVTRHSPTPQ